ncbi:methylmalonyl Co-A mutase-associated GTPase MeaB [Paracoccaceae bacterium GXU_MW_L88]
MSRTLPDPATLAADLLAGQRRALSRAITLVESTRADDREAARALLREVMAAERSSLRVGLSGTPGVGKSTFTEAFGNMLIEMGLKVAVLAVDPSSARSGGSILGDKTRMETLSRHPDAFIRPSPSRSTLGGVARRTREAILLCEGAGYDVIIVETVGVGQSETMVADMTDLFLLLLAPAGGDELQGVKRGIMETADIICINKADGEMKRQAERTRADYSGALRLLRKRSYDPEDFPKAVAISAYENTGLDTLWDEMQALTNWRRESGHFEARRREQARHWFRQEVEAGLMARLTADEAARTRLETLANQTAAGEIAPDDAAAQLIESVFAPKR